MRHLYLFAILLFIGIESNAQFITSEDSLHAGLDPSGKNVLISGYGEAKYSYDQNFQTATVNLTRAVFFIGYKFNAKITCSQNGAGRCQGGPGRAANSPWSRLFLNLISTKTTTCLQACSFPA
jgi:hypothetical protein